MPNELFSLVNEAADCLDAHDGSGAKALSQKAIELYPECETAWGNLAYAEILLGNLQAAFNAAREAVSINPAFATGWHNLGEACARMGRWEESLSYNDRAIALNSRNFLFYLGKGTALAGLERFQEAVESLDRALELDPSHQVARMNREIAAIRADSKKTKVLTMLLGMGHVLGEGKVDTSQIPGTVLRFYLESKNVINADLIRSFDWFARLNISIGNPTMLYFCILNSALARLVGEPELKLLCEKRLREAQEMTRGLAAK